MNDLVEKILSGQPNAVIDFYTLYSPRILSYLIKRLPRREDAQEVLNDVFLEAVDALPTLHESSNLQAWLYKIAHNKMVDYYRKRKIKSFLFSQIPYLELIATEISQPEFIHEKNKVRDKIEATFHALSHKYQQILRLHYEEQLPVKKIAEILQLTPKATESRLYRARQQFIKAYERA
jgi:RNA polymerase sigma-70 factor, ECF subfamily